jgi:hypothetical protein
MLWPTTPGLSPTLLVGNWFGQVALACLRVRSRKGGHGAWMGRARAKANRMGLLRGCGAHHRRLTRRRDRAHTPARKSSWQISQALPPGEGLCRTSRSHLGETAVVCSTSCGSHPRPRGSPTPTSASTGKSYRLPSPYPRSRFAVGQYHREPGDPVLCQNQICQERRDIEHFLLVCAARTGTAAEARSTIKRILQEHGIAPAP